MQRNACSTAVNRIDRIKSPECQTSDKLVTVTPRRWALLSGLIPVAAAGELTVVSMPFPEVGIIQKIGRLEGPRLVRIVNVAVESIRIELPWRRVSIRRIATHADSQSEDRRFVVGGRCGNLLVGLTLHSLLTQPPAKATAGIGIFFMGKHAKDDREREQ